MTDVVRRLRLPSTLTRFACAALFALPAPPAALQALVERSPARALLDPLHRYEAEHTHGPEAASAAFVLGQLHYARGEYRQAADAFGRAAARTSPDGKAEARYWAGVSWLGAGAPDQARAVLEEAAAPGSPRHAEAVLGIAVAWESSGRPERAFNALQALLAEDAGEVAPAALEHLIDDATRLGRAEAARTARVRLMREFPRSMEATRASQPAAVAPSESRVMVQIGAFADPARARQLAQRARQAGFEGARATSGGPAATPFLVVLGAFPSADQGNVAGERAARTLGVTWRLTPAP